MLFRNPASWKNIDGLRGLLFFVQRLEELTYPYTLDSYKTPTTSIQGLLGEAISLLRQSERGEDSEKIARSLNYIVAEVRFRLRGNWIARGLSSIDVDNVLSTIETSEKVQDKLRGLKLLSAELEPEHYIAKIVENVIELADKPAQKIKLNFLAREMASVLQSRGMSRDHISSCIVSDFYAETEVTQDIFKPFCQKVYPHHHRYRVLLGASKDVLSIDDDVLMADGILALSVEQYRKTLSEEGVPLTIDATYTLEPAADAVTDESGEGLEADDREDDELLDEEEDEDFLIFEELESRNLSLHAVTKCLALVHTSATDYHSAVSKSVSKIESIFNHYRLFNHKAKLEVAPFAVAEQACCGGLFKRVDYPDNTMHYIRDMRAVAASSTMKRFSDKITLDAGPDRTKFRNIVNIHGMSLSSSSDDIQLVNLWTCLETVSPSDQTASKVSNVVARVVPVLLLGYFNRLISNALFDVLRWNRRALSQVLKGASISGSSDIKDGFYELLSRQEHDKYLSELLDKCGNFELLRFRLFEIAGLLRDRSKAKDKIDQHEKLVSWQLHRIYRTRNSIVHAGESPPFTPLLVENAHDFFDQAMMFCLEVSAWKPGYDTFLSCFDYAQTQHVAYRKALDDPGQTLIWTLPKHNGRSFIFEEETD